MKKRVLALAAVSVLSSMQAEIPASAESPVSTDSVNLDSVSQKPKGDNLFLDALKDTTLKGYARGEYIYSNGRDGFGQGFRLFLTPTIQTGEVAGFSLTAGLIFTRGSGAPNGDTIANFINGTRGFSLGDNQATDIFGVSDLYLNKRFVDAKTIIKAGAMLINTPLNSPSGSYGDRGLGVELRNKSLDGMEFFISTYGSWMTDNIALQNGQATVHAGIGNELTIAGFKGNFAFAGLENLNATLTYAYADKLFNMMLFGELGYKVKLEDGGYFGILAQVAGTIMSENPHFQNPSNATLSGWFATAAASVPGSWAPTRGLYNLQLNWASGGYSGNIGYAGSFAQAYGAMLDAKGDFKIGGALWNSVVAGGVIGFGITGSGSYRGTDIQVAYTQHNYKINQWDLGLGFAYVGGANRMAFMTKGSDRLKTLPNRGGATVGKMDFLTMDATMYEISPSLTYNFTPKLSGKVEYSQIVGDMILNRTKVTILYKF